MKNSKKTDVVREEYLKKVGSPNYRKAMKRSMQQLETYNRMGRNNSLKSHELRKIAEYFLDDIKSPIFTKNVVEKDNDDSAKNATKPIKI